MQTALADFIRDTPDGERAERILRACVHCGFCTATCPTYQILGDELDGPRGRIYQIKQVLEGAPPSPRVQTHLDRCLTCRACETTCPSGVEYGRLLEIGRRVVDARVKRPPGQRILRRLLLAVVPYRRRIGPLLAAGKAVRPLLPRRLREQVPRPDAPGRWPAVRHARRMLILDGCVQPAAAPAINAAAARVLDRLGISLIRAKDAGCCGAMSHHMGEEDPARAMARRNIDAWWTELQAGAEAVVITASACGLQVKDYGELLADDPAYAEKARRVSALARDMTEILAAEDLSLLGDPGRRAGRIACHTPCTLQHGQPLGGMIEAILQRAGFPVTPVANPHLCCGSAGTYSLLQPALSEELRERKLADLQGGDPDLITTANIGCLLHLRKGAPVPVVHWIQLLDPEQAGPPAPRRT